MATNGISGISDINTALPSPQSVQGVKPALRVSSQIGRLVEDLAVTATPQELTLNQKNALLINEILRQVALTASGAENPLLSNTNPFLTLTEASQELTPIQQNALLINETLSGLGAGPEEPRDILLINELSPALEAAGVNQNLDLVQETALRVNEALPDVALPASQPSPSAVLQNVPTAGEEAADTALENLLVTREERRVTTEGIVAEAAGLAAPRTEVITTAGTTPAAAVASQTPVATPITTPLVPATELVPPTTPLTLRPDLTPYVVTAHEPRTQNPIPGTVELIMKDVQPLMPVSSVRPIGSARLRQARVREGERSREMSGDTPLPGPAQVEKSIRLSLGQANENMTANGPPLHLVFAKHDEEYAVNVYDCSDNEACRVSYEVPVTLQDLPQTLDNLEHETGIIVDTKS